MSRFADIKSALTITKPAKKQPDDNELPDDLDDIEEETTETKSKKKDKEMTEQEISNLKAEAKAEGIKESNARMNAVFANAEYAGREKLAHSLLATSLSAEEVGTQLAAAPKIEPSAIGAEIVSQERSDDAARQVMAEEISKNKNSDIDVSGGVGTFSQADDSLIKNMKSRFGDKN